MPRRQFSNHQLYLNIIVYRPPRPLSPSKKGAAGGGWVVTSVGRPQDLPDFGVLGHERSQPVIVTCILPGDVAVGEREVAVGVQTGRDPQSVGREITFIHVLALHVEDAILGGCHVEAAVGQRVEVPVTAVVVLGHPFGDSRK